MNYVELFQHGYIGHICIENLLEHVSEGEEDRVGDGQMNSQSVPVLHGKGKLRADIGGKLMKRPSSCSGAK